MEKKGIQRRNLFIFYHLEYSDYCLHSDINVSADVSFSFLQVFQDEPRTSHTGP